MEVGYIPTSIQDKAAKFFTNTNMIAASRLFSRPSINISFQKGSSERYFIITGIVSDGGTFETKVVFKNNHVQSNCSCSLWTEEGHCPHAAGLYIKFLLNEKIKEDFRDKKERSIVDDINLHGHGAHVEDYGMLIHDASQLKGARPNSTYSSLQYVLTNRKIVNFPIPKNFEGKLKIKLVRASEWEPYKVHQFAEKRYVLKFLYENLNGDEYEEISIFESLYLFNWKTGETFHLPIEMQNLARRLKLDGGLYPINDLIRLTFPLNDLKQFEVLIGDKSLNDFDYHHFDYRFSIEQSKRKSYLSLNLELIDNDKRICPPSHFELITQDNGLLESFRTKTDAATFIEKLALSLKIEDTEYKKVMHSAKKKTQLQEIVDGLIEKTEDPFIDPSYEAIYLVKHELFKHLFISMVENFGSNFARFSRYNTDEKLVTFEIPKNQLFSGIAGFYATLGLHNIPLFYHQKQVKSWSSNIRFERRQNNMNWFELDLIVSDDDWELIRNAQIGDNFFVSDQGLVIMEQEEKELLKFMKKYTKHEAQTDQTLDEDKAKRFNLSFQRSRIFELFELKKHGINGALTKEEEDLCEKLINLEEMPKYELPEIFQGVARNYQVEGYNWLRFLHESKLGACLADDMGLGKTLQTIMFLQSILPTVDKVLIVCPVSILLNWKNEIERFGDFNCHVYYGDNREHTDAKIILTSYGVMKKEAHTTFAKEHFDVLIMDEVQHLKNIRSQGANAARALNANFRICLTGTPVENDLSEFYNIMDLSIPGIWGEIGFIKSTSSKKSRLVAKKTVRPFILRRTKEQVLTELPEKEEHHIFLSFSENERENYIQRLLDIRHKIENVPKGRRYGEILKSLLELRQLCLWQKKKSFESTKVDFLIENLEQILEENHKVLVFSQFTTYLDLIENKVRENSWDYARIDGTQSFKKRASEVERFQEGDAKVFLISLKAGGVGLNLTAASYIFLMDPWWNPAVESQAIDRAHRIGQKNKLTVYRPIIKESVEEKVLNLQNTKRELFQDLMGSGEDEFYNGKLTMDDFQTLLT